LTEFVGYWTSKVPLFDLETSKVFFPLKGDFLPLIPGPRSKMANGNFIPDLKISSISLSEIMTVLNCGN